MALRLQHQGEEEETPPRIVPEESMQAQHQVSLLFSDLRWWESQVSVDETYGEIP